NSGSLIDGACRAGCDWLLPERTASYLTRKKTAASASFPLPPGLAIFSGSAGAGCRVRTGLAASLGACNAGPTARQSADQLEQGTGRGSGGTTFAASHAQCRFEFQAGRAGGIGFVFGTGTGHGFVLGFVATRSSRKIA